ncbi:MULTISPECIES: TrkH family potassium uptake protein [Bacillus]|uniref:TrkH family potassium uptake protein n=1 Tax=Bacillus TaxID=1386 RepID=UPI002243E476|nr:MULTISPECIES: TrkH family potassium uptake protein [Bacillus]MDN5389637.1 TrkH family potassium uptake protein [Bacillus sp. LB7]MEC1020513.1 TrkH family potassium uptake protein [Bacillus paralicheniformis]MEC1026842.1 TrkH family potassium uptake protein [Bacillus paralicheniformis]MEC1036098.1 TrkH family potassium uptake protein [Bacillus paralicheniformis]MEC1049133.1 TrkH family potassium uptake protein [Bacillus paralicheniformis]
MKFKQIQLSPSQLLVLVFLFFIILGTLLLKTPAATSKPIGWIDTLFTSTSAMTVTGLAVVDTGTDYTMFGQLMILVLIQVGGLGIMSFAVLIFIMLGKKIGLKERLLIQQSLNQTSLGGIIKLIKSLFIYSIAIEMLAMLILTVKWVPEYGFARGVYYSLFHAVSAFNNAGFSIWPDSLMRYEGDPLVNLVISFLFIIGGIGFTVLSDLWHKRNFKKLSLHSKLMIYGTFIINLSAMIFIFLLEYQNQKTLGMLPPAEKLWGAYFQAVTPRTAGFNTADIGSLNESTITLLLLLMFVGAGSASTGGGIKLTTFLVILLSVITFLKGKKHISIAKKTLKDQLIIRSLAISTISVLLILAAVFILNMTEPKPFLAILFEVVSAFGTVGLSMGITADLTPVGKILIIFIMFLGKLGPLTLAFSLARPEQENIRYSSEDILTG